MPFDLDTCVQRIVNVEKVAATVPRGRRRKRPVTWRGCSGCSGIRSGSGSSMPSSKGVSCVCDLAACLGLPESNVSHSLRLLRTAGVVRNRRAGRMVHYSLDDAHVRVLLDLSREHVGHAGGGAS